MAARPPAGGRGATQASTSRAITTKKQIVIDYKTRLKDNLNSLKENLMQIVTAAKVPTEDSAHKLPSGRMAEYYTVKNEMCTRAVLMVRAVDELLRLSNEVKEFLIARDFSYLSHSMDSAERKHAHKLKMEEEQYDNLRLDVTTLSMEVDRELQENFGLRH
ncbi:Surfeit locus protein 5 containing protein [Aphelenchoides avenae]|nr:Surfeit locus protein 5 containing protein [Aphelenchus avenae]